MATTLTTLAARVAADNAIMAAVSGLAAIRHFSTSFRELSARRGSAIRVPIFASTGGATDFHKVNNNYAQNAKEVSGVDVNVDKHVIKGVSYDDFDLCETIDVPFWEGAGKVIGDELARGIASYVLSFINKTEIPKTPENELVFTASKANFAMLRAQCAKCGIKPEDTTVLLDPVRFATLLSALDSSLYGGSEAIRGGYIPALFGFAAVTECGQLSQDPDEKLVGALVVRDSIAVAGRYLEPGTKSCYDEVGKVSDEKSGLTLGIRRFADPKTGDSYLTGEALFGARLLQPTKIVRLVSEATA